MENFSWMNSIDNLDPSLLSANMTQSVNQDNSSTALFDEQVNSGSAPELGTARSNLNAAASVTDAYGVAAPPPQHSMRMQPPTAPYPAPHASGYINPTQSQPHGVPNQAGQRRPPQLQLQAPTTVNTAYPPQLLQSPYPQTPLQAPHPFYGHPGLPYFNQPQGYSPVGCGLPVSAQSLTAAEQILQAEHYLHHLKNIYGAQPNVTSAPPAPAQVSSHRISAPVITKSNKRKKGEKAPSAEPGWAEKAYPGPFPQLPAWGPIVHGRPLFQYNEFGELQMHKTYSAQQIKQFLDENPRLVEIWVQQSPPQTKNRTGPNRNRCCWSCCPARDRSIESGWLRVGFYEQPYEYLSGERDPLKPASQMHLFCFEHCFDPVTYHLNGQLRPDNRHDRYPKEDPNKTHLDKASDKNILGETYMPWFEGKLPQAERRPYDDTLSFALTHHHLQYQPARRGFARDVSNDKKLDGNRKTIDYHIGNLLYYLKRALPVKRSQYAVEDYAYDADNQFQAGAGNLHLTVSGDGAGLVDSPAPLPGRLENAPVLSPKPAQPGKAASVDVAKMVTQSEQPPPVSESHEPVKPATAEKGQPIAVPGLDDSSQLAFQPGQLEDWGLTENINVDLTEFGDLGDFDNVDDLFGASPELNDEPDANEPTAKRRRI